MRLELKSRRAYPVREILNCIERRLAKMGIEELQYFNVYCMQGIDKHVEFVPAKCDRVPYDPATDHSDEGNSITQNF